MIAKSVAITKGIAHNRSSVAGGLGINCYNPSGEEAHCAGALILLEKIERPSQMMRICGRLGLYDRTKLDMAAPVYDSFEEMREAMETEWHR